jgi:hypothetical protein
MYAGWEAARWAVGRVGLAHPVIAAALRAGYSEAVPVLAAELDDLYLELQGRSDADGPDSPAVLAAFAHARAAAAVVFAAEDQAEEAVYEAALATDAVAELRPVVRAAALAE